MYRASRRPIPTTFGTFSSGMLLRNNFKESVSVARITDLRALHTGNAESDDLEEASVCYLQILLADELPAVGRKRMMADMDSWGYSFRLGSACRWFKEDADDARKWLLRYQLIDTRDRPLFTLRGIV